MDDQSSRQFVKDLTVQPGDSDSETDEELAKKASEDHELNHRLFDDAVQQSGLKFDYECCGDESDFTADSEQSFDIHSSTIDVTGAACRLFYGTSPQQPSELLEDSEFYSGPDEWRHIWEWELGECNRVIAEQNTQQYDEAENCTDTDESVNDVGSNCDSDVKECPIVLCTQSGMCTLVDNSEDVASAVSSSVVVTEPVFCTQSADTDLADTSSDTCDRVMSSSDAIQSVLDDVVNSCMDKDVAWDSADESGVTELDRQNDICDTQFPRDFTSDSSEGRVLSMCIPAAGSSCAHHDHLYTDNNCTENGFISGYAASSLFAQRPCYGSGAHGRPVDSKWNPSRTPPTTDDDSCRWKTRKSWRKNSADGLDSAGCSPKDDEDDDSDDEAPENFGAAALKQSKISPAGGYHAGSSYYFPMAKEKSWLARCDDRQHPASSENNSSCPEPSDDSYYSRYQFRRSDEGTPTGRGFGANSEAVMERMMRRKEARRQRESANMTSADSVAGYRGRDCSIEELIEYIDAKPPSVPKTGQRRTGTRKSRKKKRSSNRPSKSDNGNVKSAAPFSNYGEHSGPCLDKTSPEKSAAEPVAAANGGAGSINVHETSLSLGEDKVDRESVSELPLHCDTFFQMLPSGSSSSNMSDADNVPDSRIDSSFRDYATYSEDYRETVEIPSHEAGSRSSGVRDNMMASFDSEPMAVIHLPDSQSTEAATSVNVDEFGTLLLNSTTAENTGSNEKTTHDSESHEKSKITHSDTSSWGDEIIATNTENYSLSVSSSCCRVTEDAGIGLVDGVNVIQRRHSEGLSCTAVHQEIAGQPGESVCSIRKVCTTDTGQSTPSSSISDARDTLDFDSQSLADDVSSDFDFSVPTTSHESDFTIVTQKKKKKLARQNVRSAGCLQRTFYNRNHRNGVAVGDWQSPYGNESVLGESGIMPSTEVAVTCSTYSSNMESHSLSVNQQTGISLEIAASSEFAESLASDRQTGSDTNSMSSVVSCEDSNVTTNSVRIQTSSASTRRESSSQLFSDSSAVSSQMTTRTVKDVTRSSAERKTEEKVFLDTRRPNMGAAPAPAFSEFSFWYDVNIPENQSTSAQTDTSSDIGNHRVNAEVSLTSNSANLPTDALVTSLASSVTCTISANTHSYIDSCASHAPVSLSSAAGDSSLSVTVVSQLPTSICMTTTQADNSSQTSVEPLLSQTPACYVTLTSDVSSSRDTVTNSAHSGRHVIRPVVSSSVSESPAVVSASAIYSVRHPSDRSRQLFDLRDAQLFLYSEFQQVVSAKSRDTKDTVYFADADSDRS